jgi:sulfur carrier protein
MNETAQEIAVSINGTDKQLAADMTVAALLEYLNISRGGVAVAINDTIIVRSAQATHRVNAGDRIEILHAVAGG